MKLVTVKKLAKNKVLIAVVAVLLLIFLFVVLKPMNNDAPAPVREFNIEIQNGKLTDDISALQAYEGQSLIFNVTGDIKDELHIHGYDKTIAVEAGKVTRVEFDADKTGRFEIELHEAGQDLTVLEVNPKP